MVLEVKKSDEPKQSCEKARLVFFGFARFSFFGLSTTTTTTKNETERRGVPPNKGVCAKPKGRRQEREKERKRGEGEEEVKRQR